MRILAAFISLGRLVFGVAICDAVDFGATMAAGRKIPADARRGVLVIAAVFAVLSTVAAIGTGGSREKPAPPPAV